MAIASSGLIVLDPTAGPVVVQISRASRPTSLEGLRVGFLDNSKPNSDKVLLYLDEMLQERYGIGASLHRRKPSASRVVPAAMLDELVRECDAIVAGVGD